MNPRCCPHCGGSIDDQPRLLTFRDFTLDEASGTLSTTPPTRFYIHLTPLHTAVLAVFFRRPNIVHDYFSIWSEAFGSKPDSDQPEPKIVDVVISRLRPMLSVHGLGFETLWGQGKKIMTCEPYVHRPYFSRIREDRLRPPTSLPDATVAAPPQI